MKLERLESKNTQNAPLGAQTRVYVREGRATGTLGTPPKKQNEKLIEKKLRESVKNLGGLALKFWPVSFTGFPDRMILMPHGIVRFVELKSTGKQLKPRQKIVMALLVKLGFEVYVIDTIELLEKFLNKIEHDLRTA